MSLPNPYQTNQLQRLAQRNAAITGQQNRFTTVVPQHHLQMMQGNQLGAMANHLAQQHMAAHTQHQQLVLSQQMAAQLQQAAQQQMMGSGSSTLYNNSYYNTLGGIGITTSSSLPPSYVWISNSTGTATSTASTTMHLSTYADDIGLVENHDPTQIHIADGEGREIFLPDGTRIEVKRDGSFKIEDKDAKVTYRANRVRDFNRYINVSDRLEEFIAFCGDQAVKQGEMLELPIKLFVAWLAIEAAKADKEDPPEVDLLPALEQRKHPSCRVCGHLLKPALAEAKIFFCSEFCFKAAYLAKTEPEPIALLPPPEKMRPHEPAHL